MNKLNHTVFYLIVVSLFGFTLIYSSNNPPRNKIPLNTKHIKPNTNFCKIPLHFIANKGQVNPKARFYIQTSKYTLWLTPEALVFDSINSPPLPRKRPLPSANQTYQRDVSRMVFLGARKNPHIISLSPLSHPVNYFRGKDKSKWQTNVPTSQAILYRQLYKKIDLKVYSTQKQIEYDWIVNPGANPKTIRIKYHNVKRTHIDSHGNLIIETTFGKLTHKKPIAYQEYTPQNIKDRSKKHAVEYKYIQVRFRKTGENAYGFEAGNYNPDRPLIIDPVVLTYSTYLGGSSPDGAESIAVDSSGYVYVTGFTWSSDFPTVNQYQTQQGSADVFVAKLDPSKSGTSSLLYSSYIGGTGSEFGQAIAVDSAGCVYVTGTTSSSDFPTLNQYQTQNGISDAFVIKMDPGQSGVSSLLYATYLGGSDTDGGWGIAVDASGYAYVTGVTASTNFPTLNQYQTDPADSASDAFISKLDPTQSGASSLLYSTYLGGGNEDHGTGIAVGTSGIVYATGWTESIDFPTFNQYMADPTDSNRDAFITRLDTTKTGTACLLYSTYLGGGAHDYANAIAVDTSNRVYIAGYTTSTDFPVLNQYMTDPGDGNSDAFVARLDPTQSGTGSLLYSTYLGGNSAEEANGIDIDSAGTLYVTGYTISTDFPTRFQFQTDPGDSLNDAFVTRLDPGQNGTASFLYSTYLGGGGNDSGQSIAVDNNGYIYTAGWTESTDFPTFNQYQTDPGDAQQDAFITRFFFAQVHPDFNGDGKTDLLWRRNPGTYTGTWLLNGVIRTNVLYLNSLVYQFQSGGTDDFNGDGSTDIFWRSTFSPGENQVEIIKNMQRVTFLEINSLPTTWDCGGVADFNSDGKPDILWRHSSTGQNGVWFMNGSKWIGYSWLPTLADINWKCRGLGDFNSDGHPDILWRHQTTGQNGIWFMNGATRIGQTYINSLTDTDWQCPGVGDFNGDGKPDIIWRHKVTGQNAVWFMDGAKWIGFAYFKPLSDLNWVIGN